MRLIKLPEVMEKTALSKASIYRKMKKAEFPERVTLEGRAVGWLEEDIDVWITRTVMMSHHSLTY